jgi:hypothetical protein
VVLLSAAAAAVGYGLVTCAGFVSAFLRSHLA